jgi:hypothetical protein
MSGIQRCAKCGIPSAPVAYKVIELERRNKKIFACKTCWEQGIESPDWIKETPSDRLAHLQLRQGLAIDTLDQLETLVKRTTANLKEEMAIRQMAAFDRIADEVAQKYQPELEALRSAIATVRKNIETLAEEVEDFAA